MTKIKPPQRPTRDAQNKEWLSRHNEWREAQGPFLYEDIVHRQPTRAKGRHGHTTDPPKTRCRSVINCTCVPHMAGSKPAVPNVLLARLAHAAVCTCTTRRTGRLAISSQAKHVI